MRNNREKDAGMGKRRKREQLDKVKQLKVRAKRTEWVGVEWIGLQSVGVGVSEEVIEEHINKLKKQQRERVWDEELSVWAYAFAPQHSPTSTPYVHINKSLYHVCSTSLAVLHMRANTRKA